MSAIAEQTTKENTSSAEVEVPDGLIGFGTSQGFQMMQRVAKALSMSTLVPKQYQNNIPNCIVALNMANRIGADPLMVMQNLYVVHGNPSWSSQFLIATFNSCGRFSSLRYQWVGTQGKDDWGCYATAVELNSGEVLHGAVVTMELAKKEGWFDKSGSKWKTMPQQMLMYRSAAWFVRAYAPELAMGLHTVEEFSDTHEAPKAVAFKKNPSALSESTLDA
jgi:hypothetical protein